MQRYLGWAIGGLGAVSLLWLAGCTTTGAKADQTGIASKDHVMNCRLCYDETITVRRGAVHGKLMPRNKTIKVHACPDCKSHAKVYTQDGQLMVQCDGCTPKGVPCDKCLPPSGG